MTAGVNLTQAQAQRRAALLDVESYDIHVDLTGPGDRFTTTTVIRFGCRTPGASTTIECAAERIIAARLNGRAVDLDSWAPATGLPLDGLSVTNELTVRAEFGYAAGLWGLFRTVDPADGAVYAYSSFEPGAAQRVFACFDQPDLKAAFTWQAVIPSAWRAISNMPVATTSPGPDGSTVVGFAPSPRMSTYVTVLCAGPFAEARSRVEGRDLGIFHRASMTPHLDADAVFALTRRGMAFYETEFGQPYPLPKLDYVAAPEYRGAMENFGCVVFNERDFVFRSRTTPAEQLRRGAVIMHELAHMWFGNLVTMRWWDDLWLNEAFATWASYWCLQAVSDFAEPWADFAVQHKARGLKADQEASAHPVYSDAPDVEAAEAGFDDITYRKGASVIKQLAAYLGEPTFAVALRDYFSRHAWSNATFGDFVACLEKASGRDVTAYADQWLRTAQASTLRVEATVGADGRYEQVVIVQEAPAAHPTLRTHRVDVALYDRADGTLQRRGSAAMEISEARTPVPALTGQPAADAILPDDNDLTFAKLRFDERTWQTVRTSVSSLPGQLQRAVCWTSAADMLHSIELPAREFVRMVCACLPAEPSGALAGIVLREADAAVDYFADASWRPTGRRALAQAAWSAVHSAEAGSALQLMWLRCYCGSAGTAVDLERLRSWLDGAAPPPGVSVDQELRWLILQSLAAAGAAGEAEVEREFAADNSVGGRYAASTTRAMVATPQAKELAWQTALAPGTSVPLRRAILTGFTHPAHTALTEPYTARYFAQLNEVWREQGGEAARYVAEYGFPAAQVSSATLAAADGWLADGAPSASLAKVVATAADRMRRALAARELDRSAVH
ncbi:aminopeptidase N [Catellatospora methionotrophica]|uniref:aminopeptidase N n=1 Tax=Catellatospora methionotrophica TaxID=121620 RepID=UPI0033D988B5